MKVFWLTAITEIFLLFCTNGLQAQETVISSGGNAKGYTGTVSYSVGQVVYAATTSADGKIAEGVQHPCEIFVVTGIEEAAGIHLDMVVYPNPTSDFLLLIIEDYKLEILTYQLCGIDGSLLQNGKIAEKETIIPTGDLSPAVYFLRISNHEKEMKTFKIIKK
ncbi:MAG: T9SS type A sorting domain-containing protein [Bacteroidales bacterium]|nr:T9SS type A sorting domain-containing protein [Bacteroidales bacterium]